MHPLHTLDGRSDRTLALVHLDRRRRLRRFHLGLPNMYTWACVQVGFLSRFKFCFETSSDLWGGDGGRRSGGREAGGPGAGYPYPAQI